MDSNPYVTVGSPNYAVPLVNLFGQNQAQGGQQQGKNQGQGGQQQQQPTSGQKFGALIARTFNLGPYAQQQPQAGAPLDLTAPSPIGAIASTGLPTGNLY